MGVALGNRSGPRQLLQPAGESSVAGQPDHLGAVPLRGRQQSVVRAGRKTKLWPGAPGGSYAGLALQVHQHFVAPKKINSPPSIPPPTQCSFLPWAGQLL